MLMQDDITWGVKDLVSKGIADPKRVAIMGGSYGGYATLAGLAFTPDLYAAGVDIVGPSNLITLLGSIPAYWEAGMKQFKERMGDPSTPDGKALLEKQSPLNSASKIKVPLMIIQGANDPRVKKAESDQIAIALRDMHHDVVYLCAPDEGHGYQKPINNLAAMGKAEVFLGKALHARYQEEMKPDAKKRLEEITVDVSKLTLTKKVNVVAMKEMPAPTSDFAKGEYTYAVTLEMSGQKIPMTLNRVVKLDNDKWVVTDVYKSGMGDQTEEGVYTKGTLHPVSRKTNAGGQIASSTFAGNKITASAGGKSNTTTVDGAYMHDGGGNDMLVARLPLKVGYESGIYVADQEGKATLSKIVVASKETINNTECYKCQLISADDPNEVVTYYIGVADKLNYKMEAPITGMPGAKMTMELKK
jgi:dienelactone hydrolase